MHSTRITRIILAFISLSLVSNNPLQAWVTLNNFDTNPIFTSIYEPGYLTRNLRLAWLEDSIEYCQEYVQVSFSPFYQSSTQASNSCKQDVPLGDIFGRWAVPPLFYPEDYHRCSPCTTNPPCNTDVQQRLFNCLQVAAPGPGADGTPTIADVLTGTCKDIINPSYLDSRNEQFGYYSVAEKYQKYGIRFQLDWLFFEPCGVRIQTGVVDIKLVPCFTDLTCSATGMSCPGTSGCEPSDPCTADTADGCITTYACVDVYSASCKAFMIDRVMKQTDAIANAIGVNITDYENRGMEDLFVRFFWRKPFEVNKNRAGWPFQLFTPYITFDVSAPTGTTGCVENIFCLPTGNSGHTGVGFSMGATVDFVKSVELGAQVEVIQYMDKAQCLRVPTQMSQAGFYPRTATLMVKPGITWSFNISLNAYHFLERLSGYVSYIWSGHGENSYNIIKADTNFNNIAISKLVQNSKWENQLVNLGLTYDISPFIAIGFAWQAPGPRRNAFRSNTVLFSIIGTF